MKRRSFAESLSVATLSLACMAPSIARADASSRPAPVAAPAPGAGGATWGSGRVGSPVVVAGAAGDVPLSRARELLMSARSLDEAAAIEEVAAKELSARLTSLRTAAHDARERADRASPEERDLLSARADDLATDVIITEAEVSFNRRAAVENRRVARELRARAVKLAREASASAVPIAGTSCDPPFSITADGRKVYRVECLK